MRRLLAREVPGDATEEQCVGDAVDGGVEERTALARGVGRLGEGTVEQIGQRGENHQHQTES